MKITYGRFWGNLGVYHDTHPESLCISRYNQKIGLSHMYSLKKSKGLVKDQKIIPLKMFMDFENVGIILVLFEIWWHFVDVFTHVVRPSMSSPIMARKGVLFHATHHFFSKCLKARKDALLFKTFLTVKMWYFSLCIHEWHLPIWKIPLQHFFQAWKVALNLTVRSQS